MKYCLKDLLICECMEDTVVSANSFVKIKYQNEITLRYALFYLRVPSQRFLIKFVLCL
jgi:hypothetical protein